MRTPEHAAAPGGQPGAGVIVDDDTTSVTATDDIPADLTRPFRIESDMWADPRLICLSGDATRLWVMVGSWAAGHGIDGFIPAGGVPQLGAYAERQIADEVGVSQALVSGDIEAIGQIISTDKQPDTVHGLWEKVDGGFRISDWYVETEAVVACYVVEQDGPGRPSEMARNSLLDPRNFAALGIAGLHVEDVTPGLRLIAGGAR